MAKNPNPDKAVATPPAPPAVPAPNPLLAGIAPVLSGTFKNDITGNDLVEMSVSMLEQKLNQRLADLNAECLVAKKEHAACTIALDKAKQEERKTIKIKEIEALLPALLKVRPDLKKKLKVVYTIFNERDGKYNISANIVTVDDDECYNDIESINEEDLFVQLGFIKQKFSFSENVDKLQIAVGQAYSKWTNITQAVAEVQTALNKIPEKTREIKAKMTLLTLQQNPTTKAAIDALGLEDWIASAMPPDTSPEGELVNVTPPGSPVGTPMVFERPIPKRMGQGGHGLRG